MKAAHSQVNKLVSSENTMNLYKKIQYIFLLLFKQKKYVQLKFELFELFDTFKRTIPETISFPKDFFDPAENPETGMLYDEACSLEEKTLILNEKVQDFFAETDKLLSNFLYENIKWVGLFTQDQYRDWQHKIVSYDQDFQNTLREYVKSIFLKTTLTKTDLSKIIPDNETIH